MRASPLLPLLAGLAGCHADKPDWAQRGQQTAVPAAVCKEIDKAVAQIRASRGVEVTDKGEATLPAAAWNAMPADQHDQFLRTLAFHAACVAGAQSDAQPVVVRGDDGIELARRTISTRVDTGELLRD
ncbi:MAG: hypothetical protein JO013_00145 [Alphaproteobacteria bacterium]|nr:hypothetical protein [Alphaproteobacteria bacterium]